MGLFWSCCALSVYIYYLTESNYQSGSLFKVHSVVINLNATRNPGHEGEAHSSYPAPSVGMQLAKLIYTYYVSMHIHSICNM